MSDVERIDNRELVRRNRELRNAVELIIEQLENDDGNDVDCKSIRDAMPNPPGEDNPVRTPWERGGYDDKQAWLEAKRPDNAQGPEE